MKRQKNYSNNSSGKSGSLSRDSRKKKKVSENELYTVAQLRKRWHKLAREDYHFYCQYVHRGLYHPASHTAFMAKKMEAVERGEIDNIMFFLPPRHSKSMTITETFPSWYIGRNPDRAVIEISYNGVFAQKFGKRNKDKIKAYGKPIFNVELDPEKRSSTNWALNDRFGQMLASGIGGTITGEGADLLIIDDPIKNRMEAYSETYRNRLWEEYDATIKTRLHANASQILIMTRWHEDDLAGRILKRTTKDWEVIKLPALCTDPKNDVLGRRMGEALWPEGGYTREEMVSRKENMSAKNWLSLYQQEPSPEEGDIINKGWWRFYTSMPSIYDFDYIIQSWDCAFKDEKDSSYVVGQVWGVKGAEAYLLDQKRDHLDFIKTIDAIKHMKRKWERTGRIYIEEKANGNAVINILRSRIGGLIPVNPQGSKISRAYSVTPFIESGNVLIPSSISRIWVDDFIEECAQFPAGATDDQVDAMTQALSQIFGKPNLRPKQDKPRGF